MNACLAILTLTHTALQAQLSFSILETVPAVSYQEVDRTSGSGVLKNMQTPYASPSSERYVLESDQPFYEGR